MSYDPELLELVKGFRTKGESTLSIKHNQAAIKFAGGDKDKLASAVDYYVAELEDSKELMLARLDRATSKLMELLNSDNKGTQISAARVLVSVIDRYSKLLGLDSPIKVDSTQRHVTYTIDGVDITRIMD